MPEVIDGAVETQQRPATAYHVEERVDGGRRDFTCVRRPQHQQVTLRQALPGLAEEIVRDGKIQARWPSQQAGQQLVVLAGVVVWGATGDQQRGGSGHGSFLV